MEGCSCWKWKLLVFGIILILVRLYTSWDIWIVIGVLAIIKGLAMMFMPCKCEVKPGKKR